jgi:hypothetical protein
MNTRKVFAVIIAAVLFYSGCKEIQGPAGPPGSESLTDPSVMPKVIYTYPPANSVGPYDDLYLLNCGFEYCSYYSRFQLRFNKIMDYTSTRRAISLASPFHNLRVDTTYLFTVGGDVFLLHPTDSSGYRYNLRWRVGEVDTLKIASSAKDINGNTLPAYSMTFEPEPYFRVRNVYPANGATDVYANTYIHLRFNSPVDTSIRSKIQISPSIPGSWYIYSYDSMYVEYSYNALKSNQLYTITVSPAAHDAYGNQIGQQFTSSFTTAQFRVTQTYPSDGDTRVYPYSSINVYFTASIDSGTVRSAFKINPVSTGNFSMWDGNSNFYFYPSNGLLLDTTYTVTIDTSLRSKAGDKLVAQYTFSFKTVPFEVSYTQPYNGDYNVSRYTSVYVNFTAPIDTGSVRSSFTMKDSSGANVAGYLYLYDGSSSFNFSPSHTLGANETYTVTISTGMRSKSGTYLKSPYTFSFTTGN